MNKITLIIVILIVIAVVWYLFFHKVENVNNNGFGMKIFEIQGMKVEILKEGSGPQAKTGQEVGAYYKGTLENGQQFDSNIGNPAPYYFTLGAHRVIEGWELGVLGMKVGEKRKLTIPYQLAYGETGVAPVIPPKATLIFEVELAEIK